MRILAVDDEADVRRLLRDLLGSEGYQVTVASSAVEALVHLRLHPFNLLVLDLMMPGIDGECLAKMVAARSETNELPIIVLSCRKDVEARAWAELQGCAAYIEKPFSPSELLDAIREISRRGAKKSPRTSPNRPQSPPPPWHRSCSSSDDDAARKGRLRDLSPPSPLQPP